LKGLVGGCQTFYKSCQMSNQFGDINFRLPV